MNNSSRLPSAQVYNCFTSDCAAGKSFGRFLTDSNSMNLFCFKTFFFCLKSMLRFVDGKVHRDQDGFRKGSTSMSSSLV